MMCTVNLLLLANYVLLNGHQTLHLQGPACANRTRSMVASGVVLEADRSQACIPPTRSMVTSGAMLEADLSQACIPPTSRARARARARPCAECPDPRARTLPQFEFLSRLSKEHADECVKNMKVRSFVAGDLIIRKGASVARSRRALRPPLRPVRARLRAVEIYPSARCRGHRHIHVLRGHRARARHAGRHTAD